MPAASSIAIAGVIVAAAGAGASYVASEKAADKLEEATEATAKNARAEVDENVRRIADIQKAEAAEARTLLAGSGLGGKSRESYKDTLTKKRGLEMDWLKKSGESNVQTILSGGQAQAQSIRGQATAGLGSNIGSGLQNLAGSGMFGS